MIGFRTTTLTAHTLVVPLCRASHWNKGAMRESCTFAAFSLHEEAIGQRFIFLSLSPSLSFSLVLFCALLFSMAQRKQGLKGKRQQQERAMPAAATPDADVVELIAPHSGSNLAGKWEPDVRVPPTVATLR